MPAHPPFPWIRRLAGPVVLALFYCVGAKLGFLLAIEQSHSAPFWPPAGIALAGLLICGWRAWPGVWLGAFAANYAVFSQAHTLDPATIPWVSSFIACGNTLEALAGWFLCGHLLEFHGAIVPVGGRSASFAKASVFGFVAVALVVSLVGAAVGPAAICASGGAPWQNYSVILFTWWSGDATGILYAVPFILAWMAPPPSLRELRTRLEIVAVFAVLVLSGALVFLWSDAGHQAEELKFLTIGPMVWIATRSGLRSTTAGLVVLGIFAVVGAQHRIGPVVHASELPEIVVLQAFLWVVGVTALTLARSIATRQSAQASTREADQALAATMKAIPAFVWIAHDSECRRITGNRAAQDLLEMPSGANMSADSLVPFNRPFTEYLNG